MTKFEWQLERGAEFVAGRTADQLVRRHGYTAPVDPLKLVEFERESLRAGGADFKNNFDGKLKYFSKRRRFTLLYNTKYDTGFSVGKHHPRTRFSIAHELGHYFIDSHREYLLNGGVSHPSKSEFRRQNRQIERQADAFAASLLLPTHLVRPIVNGSTLNLELIAKLSREFQASPICTTFRAVSVSDDPCAVAGIREGQIKWMFPSERLVERSCYPRKGDFRSRFAAIRWQGFATGNVTKATNAGLASQWFSTFGDAAGIQDLAVTEHYIPVQAMETMVVLLTIDDNDFGKRDDDDDEYRTWSKERHDLGD